MIRRRPRRFLVIGTLACALPLIGIPWILTVASGGSVVSVVSIALASAGFAAGRRSVRPCVRVRDNNGRVRRSSRLSGELGWLRVSPGGNMRQLHQGCTSVDRLADYLLKQSVETLPMASKARFAEEWQDHRQYYSGWRLVWWALCVRGTALRTVTALGPAQLPRDT
jgi:hypothetical protein